jgi:hypothetical protein
MERNNINKLTKEFLLREYFKKNKSAVEISKKLKISDDAVLRRIKKYHIPKHKSNLGKKNGAWKGNKVGYSSLHEWVKNHKPKPEFCEICKKHKPYDLANISGKYKRDINDYKWVCRSCHMKEDSRLKKLHLLNRRKIKGNLYRCRNCKKFKSKEFFSKDKKTSDGLTHLCKSCSKKYYKKNIKKIKEYQHKWYLKNKKEILNNIKEYYKKNRQKIREYQHKLYLKNKRNIK